MPKHLIFFLIILASNALNAKNPTDSLSVKCSNSKITANIYPNPAQDEITIQNVPFDKGSVEICTLQGKVVKNIQIDKTADYKVSLYDLMSQPYIIKIKASDGATASSGKVIIKQ